MEPFYKGRIGVCQYCGCPLVNVLTNGHQVWCKNYITPSDLCLEERTIEQIREALRKLVKNG